MTETVCMRRTISMTILFFSACLAACGARDTESQIQQFCSTLTEVNSGSVDTVGLSELDGHTAVALVLLENSPPSLASDLERIHQTVGAWARSISEGHSMVDTFDLLSAPELIGSEGRVTDFAANHCDIDLGGPQWIEAPPPSSEQLCPAWPRVGTPLTFNHFPNLPDIAGSNYFAQNFLISKFAAMLGIETLKGAFVVEPGGRVVFRGQYPETRYFAYHPNDMDLNNLETLRDENLEPDTGSVNPFREIASSLAENRYSATLVFGPQPSRPEPNTSYVGLRKDGMSDNSFVINMLRMYHVDSGNGPGSGGVPLPSLSIYDAEGELTLHFEECDMFAPGNAPVRTEQVFPALPVIDHRARNPAQWTTSSNFDGPSDLMANSDVQYLATHYSELFGHIFVVRGKYLTQPNTRNGESPAAEGKDVRLFNLCTYNFWNGGASHCLLGNQLQRDPEGFYTLVISKHADKPENLQATHASWMDWGPYMDGQLQYRFVFRDNPIVAAIAAAADGGSVTEEIEPYVPAAVACDRTTYESGGWRACFEKAGMDKVPYM
ncbi:hypothetical protein EY643_01095 [Halioglobus maricola]|uniref:Uncharacterized protein n=1 Tax=Halioglobus maricola TaxID=2601894 RepID=A0A5P9NFR1_9GAMM|nr:hypothetical protein [Halioglobus maricola]QFU74356.1 hypothetical protein EY643_01095 [Halioglobus maricola]